MTWNRTRPNRTPVLSVVIVTYNEADRIRTCLESVRSASQPLGDVEVILVDSNSTDRTVDIASEYPITILRTPTEAVRTPGAGRYVGTAAADADQILFVDGDMEIHREWLERAVSTLSSRSDVGAVDGHLDDPDPAGTVTPVDAVRGVALYRRTALASVGGFDPYLRSLEDIHLGYELRAAGWRLLRLPEVAGTHPSRSTVTEPIRRWRRGYTVGPGQAIRRSLRSPRLLGKHLSRIRYRLGLLGWLGVGVASTTASLALSVWLVGTVVLGGYLVAKLGARGAVSFVLKKLLGIVGLVQGLSRSPRPAESYPLADVETLQTGEEFVRAQSGPSR